jgi:hypothetical protein
MSPAKSLFIRCDSIHLNSIEALIEPNTQSDILCRIPINTGYNSWLNYSGGVINKINDKIINVLSLYLSPDNQYTIELDGISWFISLTFIEYAPLLNSNSFGYSLPNKNTPISTDPTIPTIPTISSRIDTTNIPNIEPDTNIPSDRQAIIDELETYKKELENLTKAQDELVK